MAKYKHYHPAKMLYIQQQAVQKLNQLTEERNKLKTLVNRLNLVIEAKPKDADNNEFHEDQTLDDYSKTLMNEAKQILPDLEIPNVS